MNNIIVVEMVSNICNSSCLWCFRQYKCRERIPTGMMDFNNFKRFIELNKNNPFSIIPYSHGEALLNQSFMNSICLAFNNDFKLHSLHTNLAMDIEHINLLSLFKSITVNVGGGTPETHNINMNTSFNKVLDNIRKLMYCDNKVNLNVKMVINRHNYKELEILRNIINEINPQIKVSSAPLYFGCSDSDIEDKRKFIENNLIVNGRLKIKCRDDVKLNHNTGEIDIKSKLKNCYGLIPTVRFNGNVEICCRARYGEKSLGNAFTTPMNEIINSQAYKNAEEQGKYRNWVEYCKYCS